MLIPRQSPGIEARVALCILAICGAARSEHFLSNWIGQTLPVIGNQTILDLSLPGTHDTLTYDLSLKMSDGGIDGDTGAKMAQILHDLTKLGVVPSLITEYTRQNAQTQALNVTTQLDNGIRFLDIRVMLEHDSKEWYGLHMFQTNQPAINYLRQVKQWMDEHPSEIVVLWISKHGSECATGNDQWPGVSVDQKRAFWGQIQSLFTGQLFNSSSSSLSETNIATLIATGQRTIIFAADFAEFTNNSPLALDSCRIENRIGISNLNNQTGNRIVTNQLIRGAKQLREGYRHQKKFWLLSGACSQGPLLGPSTKMHFDPFTEHHEWEDRLACAKALNIPGASTLCPEDLQTDAIITNYYKQEPLMLAIDPNCQGCELPNAIYIDAVDYGGTIRTGLRRVSDPPSSPVCQQFRWSECTQHPSCDAGFTASGDTSNVGVVDSIDGKSHGACLNPFKKHYKCCRDQPEPQNSASFGYVSVVVLANLNRSCWLASSDNVACARLKAVAQAHLDAFPLKLWDDPMVGRLVAWPANESHTLL